MHRISRVTWSVFDSRCGYYFFLLLRLTIFINFIANRVISSRLFFGHDCIPLIFFLCMLHVDCSGFAIPADNFRARQF